MKLEQLFHLLSAAKKASGHSEFVIIGSNVSLAFSAQMQLPPEMTMSIDVDAYLKRDPNRIFELAKDFGEGSEYHRKHDVFLDGVSPSLATLPEGWESRLIREERDGCVAFFVDPNDMAIGKYARGEPRDVRWIRAGLLAGLISVPVVRRRMPTALFLDDAEEKNAMKLFEQDADWLNKRSNG